MQRHYGTPMPIDLFVGGANPSATLTPGASVQPVVFQPASLNQEVKGDNWPLARGILIKAVTVVDQAASGGTALNWDQLFVCFDSINTQSKLLGTLHDKTVFTGPVAKHLIEFVSNGYRYVDWARAQIAAADGDTAAVTLYLYAPFTNENFIQPEAFWPWTGWLQDMLLTVNLAAATAIAQFSTGAAIKTSFVITASLDCYVVPQPIRMLVSQWNKYQTNAATGNQNILMQAVGQQNGLPSALPGCRLAGLFELCTPNAMGGASTGDLFTSFSSTELAQEPVLQVDNFMMAYRTATGRGGPISLSAAIAAHDGSGNPNTMAATPNTSLMNVAQMYVPWRFASKNQRLENTLKWPGGNITLNRQFTVTPSSGTHTVITNEIRQLDDGKWRELERIAGLSGVPALMLSDRQLREGQMAVQAGVYQTRK